MIAVCTDSDEPEFGQRTTPAGDDPSPIAGIPRLLRLLPSTIRRGFYVTLVLMLGGAIAEMVTVGAALPFLVFVTQANLPGWRAWSAAAGVTSLGGAAVLLVAAAMTASAVRLLLTWKSLNFVTRVGHEVATMVLDRKLRQPFAMHLRANSSETLGAIEKVHGIVFGVMQPAMQGLAALVLASFMTAMLVWLDPLLTLTGMVAIGFAYGAIAMAVRPALRRSADQQAAAVPLRTRTVQEALGCIRDIILDGCASEVQRRFRLFDAMHRFSQARIQFISAAPRFVLEAAAVSAIAVATIVVSDDGASLLAAIPALGAMAFGAQRLLPLLQQAYHSWSQLNGNGRDFLHLLAVIEAPVPSLSKRAPARPLRHIVELDSVSYRHVRGDFVLRDVGLALRRGQHVGLTGPSGSGKSTLLDLLMGLVEPAEGSIRIDGERLTPEIVAGWQSTIGHVPQSPYLVDDTILANIVFPGSTADIDQQHLAAAVRDAHLSGVVEKLEAGLFSTIGERGVRLSGGERQRVALARALYRDPSLLILDEGLNALDEENEALVLRSLRRRRPDLTVAVVAHRRSTLALCDYVAILDRGRVRFGEPAIDVTLSAQPLPFSLHRSRQAVGAVADANR